MRTGTGSATADTSIFTPEQKERLAYWTKRYEFPAMGLIEALREVQEWHRHVPLESEAYVAELFQVTTHRVHEIVTFYPYFTMEPAGKYRIDLCRNLSCHLAGSLKMAEHLKSKLGVEAGKTTSDGQFSFEAVECLGACEFAPAFAVNDELVGVATEASLDRAIGDCKEGKFFPSYSSMGPGERSNSSRQVTPAHRDNKKDSLVPKGRGEGEGEKILTEHFNDPNLHQFDVYRKYGGYAGWENAKKMAPLKILEEVVKSNLRGLGGAGFPSGMKWGTVPAKAVRNVPHYLVANADESEPGCFKDRVLMECNPHALIEGMLIAGRAIEADGYFIFIRGEYAHQRRILEAAIKESREKLKLDVEIKIMQGANAYITGCDTALLETMEGKKAWPRQPPPFPTGSGLMGHPTVVNNVETLMMVPSVMNKGGEWFAKLGVPKSGGAAVFSVSGHVARPGAYEFPMGTPLRTIIEAAGGVRPGHRLKAVIPGGTSTPVLTAEEAMKVNMDFDSLRSFGSFLGAGGIIVLDETVDMVEVLWIIERFLAHESCGQCTPCREGSGWLTRILGRVLAGRGVPEDIDTLLRLGDDITGKVICALGDTVGMVARVTISKFRREFEAHISKPAAVKA